MKSEHRHELQTNDLSKILERTKPFLESYGPQLLMAVAGAIVVVIGYFVWSNSSQSRKAAGWAELAAASSAEDFDTVAEDFPSSNVAYWAKLRSAESHLQSAIPQAFSNRAGAIDSMDQAKSRFQELVDGSGVPLDVRERALMGLARALETSSDGDSQPAIDAYSKLVAEFPNSIFRPAAEARIEELKTGASQEFYAWFHQQNPTPADRTTPSDIHGGLPGMGELPVRLPDVPDALKPSDVSTENPASSDAEPKAEPAPSDDKKSDEKPAAAETDSKKAAPDKADPAPAASDDKPAESKSPKSNASEAKSTEKSE